MSDRAMSLERSPPRARFETVHPETPEQTSATRPAPAVTTNGASQQNPPQAGGGFGQDPSSDRPEQATPPKRDEEVEDADAADTFVAEYDVNPEEDARGDAADRATNHDGSRDSENLAFREGGAHPYVEDESMGESEDERSDSDTDSDSDSDDDRTDEDEDAVVDEALTDDDPQSAASAQSYLDLRTGFHEAVRALCPSADFLSFPDPEARARDAFARADLASRASPRAHTARPTRHRHALELRARRPAPRPPPLPISSGTPSRGLRASCPVSSTNRGFRLPKLW